jgi:hypothetical protein
MSLTVSKGLPNPLGKDHAPAHGPTNQQLNNEWFEFGNAGNSVVLVVGVELRHYTFDRAGNKTGEATVITFTSGALQPGHSVRVHTGTGTALDEGTVRHVYAGHGNYVWNNGGDTAVLRGATGSLIDWASYDPAPPEGAVVYRISGTNKLRPALSRTA